MRHARGEPTILRQARVIHDPPLRRDLSGHPPRKPPADGHVIPRRVGDEVLQPLLVTIRQPRRHRLDRLAPPLQQQPAHVLLALRALITADQRPVHLRRELDQCRALRVQISRPDPRLPDPNPRHAAQVPCNRKNSCTQELLQAATEVLLGAAGESVIVMRLPVARSRRRPSAVVE